MNSILATPLGVACALACAAAHAAPVYHVAQDYGDGTGASHVSTQGTVQGEIAQVLGTWSAGVWRALPSTAQDFTISGVNDRAEMSAQRNVTVGKKSVQHLFDVTAGGVATDLTPDISTPGQVGVGAISHNGTIVGAVKDAATGILNCIEWHAGVQTTIGYPPGGSLGCVGQAINAKGQIAGWADFSGQTIFQMFFYDSGTWTQVPGLHGNSAGTVTALNDHGHVVGQAKADTSGYQHAFLWKGKKSVDLGTLGGVSSWAAGLDDNDTVVGTSFDATGELAAFIYQDSQLLALTPLVDNLPAGWTLVAANGITSDGNIIVSALTPENVYHALVLTPAAP